MDNRDAEHIVHAKSQLVQMVWTGQSNDRKMADPFLEISTRPLFQKLFRILKNTYVMPDHPLNKCNRSQMTPTTKIFRSVFYCFIVTDSRLLIVTSHQRDASDKSGHRTLKAL